MEKDLEILKKYENWFYTAVYADYIRALWKDDFEVLIPIYEKWSGRKTNINTSCGKCKLIFLKKLGELYFKNKEEYESKSNSKCRAQDEAYKLGRKTVIGQESLRDSKNVSKGRKPKTNKN